jgi:hypothetical protein
VGNKNNEIDAREIRKDCLLQTPSKQKTHRFYVGQQAPVDSKSSSYSFLKSLPANIASKNSVYKTMSMDLRICWSPLEYTFHEAHHGSGVTQEAMANGKMDLGQLEPRRMSSCSPK